MTSQLMQQCRLSNRLSIEGLKMCYATVHRCMHMLCAKLRASEI